MVAKSIAKIYTNIHKPTDYMSNVQFEVEFPHNYMVFKIKKSATNKFLIISSVRFDKNAINVSTNITTIAQVQTIESLTW